MRLSEATLDLFQPGRFEAFEYDRAAQAIGIVHFGIGAFHRAHQAWYTDRAMAAGDRDWMIAGVSLRSDAVARQMNPQDGLYTLTERSPAGDATRLIGTVREVVVGSEANGRVPYLLAAPATRIVSLTITEKGYDPAESIYRHLATGLARRRAAGLGGLTLISCDNLTDNGRVLARRLIEHCAAELARWIEAECTFPNTMVDRIVPATTPADLDAVEAALGLRDEAAVVTEPISQWIIEDRFAGPRPRWSVAGAQLVSDVAPYETAKLRMLNGAHSALAYLGLARGHAFVHEALADPAIRPAIETLMRDEAAASLIPAPDQDLNTYADALLARFANPALPHRLSQIAMDGSQKIPQRWLATLAHHQRGGRQCPAILGAIGGWLKHVRGDNGSVDDPRADELAALWRGNDASGMIEALFGTNGLFRTDWTANAHDKACIIGALT